MAGDATENEQVREHVDDIGRVQPPADPDRKTLSRELINDIQHADFPSIVSAVLDEVVGPDMVGMLRTEPEARSFVEPEPAPLRLLLWNLEPLLPPDPCDPLAVHDPASPA